MGSVNHQRQRVGSAGKPKLLFLACFFPPVQGSACVRTWNIAKYLTRAGWDVTVVTPQPNVWRDIEDAGRVSKEVEHEGIWRILTGHRLRCLSPDNLRCWNYGAGWIIGGVCRKFARTFGVDKATGWLHPAEKACGSLASDDVDVVLATAPPFASFTLAKRLAGKFGRPYVLDYWDPWDSYPNLLPGLGTRLRCLEYDLIRGSSAVTMVCDSLVKVPSDLKSKMHVIPNGFDPEEMSTVMPHEFGHFAIVYAGTFKPPRRVIGPLMPALRMLEDHPISRKIPWRFHYYGPQSDHVAQQATRFGLTDRVVLHGMVPRAHALSAVKGAGVAMVITSVLEDKAEADGWIVTGKIFDAVGLGVPVLLVGPLGGDVEAVAEAAGSVRMVAPNNLDGIVSFLTDVMLGNRPQGQIPKRYSWPYIIAKLDAILHQVMDRSQS